MTRREFARLNFPREGERPALTNIRKYCGNEPHFTVQQIAKLWQLSTDTVRRIFEEEPGVLILAHEETSK